MAGPSREAFLRRYSNPVLPLMSASVLAPASARPLDSPVAGRVRGGKGEMDWPRDFLERRERLPIKLEVSLLESVSSDL